MWQLQILRAESDPEARNSKYNIVQIIPTMTQLWQSGQKESAINKQNKTKHFKHIINWKYKC